MKFMMNLVTFSLLYDNERKDISVHLRLNSYEKETSMNTKLKVMIFGCVILMNLVLSISALSEITKFTLFPQNLTLVEQTKTVTLKKGINQINFSPVSKQIILDSVYPYAEGCQFLEEKFIPPSTLSWKVKSEKDAQVSFGVLYLTQGIKWEIYYKAELGKEAKFINLISWVKVANESEIDWGPVQITFSTQSPFSEDKEWVFLEKEDTSPWVVSSSTVEISSGVIVVSSESIETVSIASNVTICWQQEEEEILYSLLSPINLGYNQDKRIWLFSLQNIPAEKAYNFDSERYGDEVREEIAFDIEDELNFILPSGRIYLYGIDSNDKRIYLGEKRLPQTLPGETCNIYLGPAKGILGERVQTFFQEVPLQPMEEGSRNKGIVREYSYWLIFYNHRSSSVKIRVIEHFYDHWEILESNPQNYTKEAGTIIYQIEVPSQAKREIYYKAKTM